MFHVRIPSQCTIYIGQFLTSLYVEDQDGWVFEENAGDADPLLLAARQENPPLAYIGLIAVRHGQDVLMDFRLDRRLDHLFIGGVQPPIPDIVKDGARKEKHVLLDDADLAAQRLQGDVPDVGARRW